MTAQPRSVSTELTLRLVVPGGTPLPVSAALTYDVADPYAVRVAFRTGGTDTVEWTFARQLLTEGVAGPVGEGDVQVWPVRGPNRGVVNLSLSSPSGRALFEVPMDALVEFLGRTYLQVPTGSESDFVDLDAELALILWADPSA